MNQAIPQAKQIEEIPKRLKPVESFGKGRTCSRPGCTHPLSIYNRGPRCESCITGSREDRMLGSLTLQELMEEMP